MLSPICQYSADDGLMNDLHFAHLAARAAAAAGIVLGRTLLADPVWPLRAAHQLKAASVKWPGQYEPSSIF
jgi:2,4-dienoyl-CoA reductase-like NADH-dependent reductase (Old Yellow Enzyme family)